MDKASPSNWSEKHQQLHDRMEVVWKEYEIARARYDAYSDSNPHKKDLEKSKDQKLETYKTLLEEFKKL